MIRLVWHNLLQRIHERRPLSMSRYQAFERIWAEAILETRREYDDDRKYS